jgi:hypothetical protein
MGSPKNGRTNLIGQKAAASILKGIFFIFKKVATPILKGFQKSSRCGFITQSAMCRAVTLQLV